MRKEIKDKPRPHEGTVQDILTRKIAADGFGQSITQVRGNLGGIIEALSLAVEARDPYTAGHQSRVSAIARMISQEMGLSKEMSDGVRTACKIHDIGKTSVPAELLSKPSKLSDVEFSLIKIHPQIGHAILKEIKFPWPISEIVLQHHERLDGSGYPGKLTGGQILIEAKILAVADVVEAISSHRPYRPALGIAPAIEELKKNRGIFYDAEVVDACLTLFLEKGFQLETLHY